MPFVTINLVLCMKNALMVFDQIMSLTKGGPSQSTESISYLIYNNGMSGGPVSYTHLDVYKRQMLYYMYERKSNTL